MWNRSRHLQQCKSGHVDYFVDREALCCDELAKCAFLLFSVLPKNVFNRQTCLCILLFDHLCVSNKATSARGLAPVCSNGIGDSLGQKVIAEWERRASWVELVYSARTVDSNGTHDRSLLFIETETKSHQMLQDLKDCEWFDFCCSFHSLNMLKVVNSCQHLQICTHARVDELRRTRGMSSLVSKLSGMHPAGTPFSGHNLLPCYHASTIG